MNEQIKYHLSYQKRKIETKYFHLLRSIKQIPGIMILGCGRSGSTYISKVFKSLGYDVGHERLGKHGISSWYLVSDQKSVPLGPCYRNLKSLNLPTVHQVRTPLDAISSMQASGKPSWQFLAKEIPINYSQDSKVLMAMKYWYYWNLKAEEKSTLLYRVEDTDKILPRLLGLGKFPIAEYQGLVEKKTNTRKHPVLSWEDLEKEDKKLASKIRELGIRYGYSELK